MWLHGHRLNQVTDAGANPSGRSSAGSRTNPCGKTGLPDEGPGVSSRIKPKAKTGAARVPDEHTSHSEGAEWHGQKRGAEAQNAGNTNV